MLVRPDSSDIAAEHEMLARVIPYRVSVGCFKSFWGVRADFALVELGDGFVAVVPVGVETRSGQGQDELDWRSMEEALQLLGNVGCRERFFAILFVPTI